MIETQIENSITEKIRLMHPPSAPVKQPERISLESYNEAIRPSDKQGSVSIKIDLSKLREAK